MTYESNQPSQQNPGIEMSSLRRIFGEPSYVMVWIPLTYMEDQHSCLRIVYQQKYCQFGLKGPETELNEGRLLDFKDSTSRKCAVLNCKYVLCFK